MKFLSGFFLSTTLLSTHLLIAQQEEILPIGFSQSEIDMLQRGEYNFLNTNNSRGISTPPAFPVRTMAQWEEVQALVITWTGFPSIQAQMVNAAQDEAEVIIVCLDSVA